MATISENLQTIKDSVDAIKQAIIDKGGNIIGDISTWADTISTIQTGGADSEESEYTFSGTISYNLTEIVVTGSLNKIPDTGQNYLLALCHSTAGLCYREYVITNPGSYTLTIDFKEPMGFQIIPVICILNVIDQNFDQIFTIIPVKFERIN